MYAYFNRFTIKMTMEQAKKASHQGRCDADVKDLCSRPEIKRQLRKISDFDLAKELSEYGAWDSYELENRADNEQRIIWIAAGNITENRG